MKRSRGSQRTEHDERQRREAGEPRPPGQRGSGVRRRGARAPVAEEPCTTFHEAYRRHRGFVWSRIRERLSRDPAGVADVRQQVFLRLNARIRAEGGVVPKSLRPVLLGLVTDEVRNHLRPLRRRRWSDREPDSEAPTSKPDPEQALVLAERPAMLRRCLDAIFARMRAADRELIELAELCGLSVQEIADRVGVAAGTAAVRLHRARTRFDELCTLLYRSGKKGP